MSAYNISHLSGASSAFFPLWLMQWAGWWPIKYLRHGTWMFSSRCQVVSVQRVCSPQAFDFSAHRHVECVCRPLWQPFVLSIHQMTDRKFKSILFSWHRKQLQSLKINKQVIFVLMNIHFYQKGWGNMQYCISGHLYGPLEGAKYIVWIHKLWQQTLNMYIEDFLHYWTVIIKWHVAPLCLFVT